MVPPRSFDLPETFAGLATVLAGMLFAGLSEHADFHVNINSVLGGGIHHPEDALIVGKRAMELGFTSTVGIIHDDDGQLRPLAEKEREVFLEMKKFEKKHFSRMH